ncbi:MAG: phage regulatory CII family protein [Betaproteobacteria bacterium]|nr:phage regulatory CII family protein [Betaproteobacteria bacterium]
MDVQDAAYNTVHDYPGGCRSLAPRLGMSPNVLQNKVNPSQEYHKLTLAEALKIQAVTGDIRILRAMAEDLGFVCVPIPSFDGVADMELLDAYTAMVEDEGQFASDFRSAMRERSISRKEFERLRADIHQQQTHEVELLARIESLVDDATGR